MSKEVEFSDGGWPVLTADEHAVSELLAYRQGPLSPFGEQKFPVPEKDLPYIHPKTYVNF